jgi:hypothetical protein
MILDFSAYFNDENDTFVKSEGKGRIVVPVAVFLTLHLTPLTIERKMSDLENILILLSDYEATIEGTNKLSLFVYVTSILSPVCLIELSNENYSVIDISLFPKLFLFLLSTNTIC